CHIIGYAPGNVEGGKDGEPVWKVIPDAFRKDFRGFDTHRAVDRCLEYELKHCGIAERQHSLVWFGKMGYRCIPNSVIEDIDPDGYRWFNVSLKVRCRDCGSEFVGPRIYWDPGESTPGPVQVASR
ncbi:unnamed protein product, partial [marine sediment metagenome]